MPRRVAILLLLAAAFTVAGCGEDGSGEEAGVQAVVSDYVRASMAGDGERACGYYTAGLRARIDISARERGLDGCAELLGSAVPYRLERVEVEMEDEGRARAALELPGEAMTETRVAVVRTRAGWRIERLGVRGGGG